MLFLSYIIIVLNLFMLVSYTRNQAQYGMKKLIFATMMLVLWIVSNLISVVATDVSIATNFTYYQYVFLILFVLSACLFSMEFSRMKVMKLSTTVLLSIVPLLIIIVVIVPQFRTFFIFYPTQNPDSIDSTLFVKYVGYYIAAAYIYSFALISAVLFYISYKDSLLVIKDRIWLAIIGIAIAILYNFLLSRGYIVSHIDVTPLIVSITFAIAHVILNSLTFNTLKTYVVENIMDEIGNIIIAYDNNGLIIFCNEALSQAFQIDRNKILGINIKNRAQLQKFFPDSFIDILDAEQDELLLEFKEKKYKRITKDIQKKNKKICKLVDFIDVTEETNFSDKLQIISTTDALTQLKNRYAFDTDIKAVDQTEENTTVMTLDFDNLKITNDILGHDYGDKILIHLSEILVNIFSENSLGIYRLGGDEFCVILQGVKYEDVLERLNSLYLTTAKLNQTHIYQMLFSIGFSINTNKNWSLIEMYKFADVSMYKSKADRKNRYTFFSDEIYEEFLFKRKLEEDLVHGIERDEFVPFFQPKFNLKTKKYDGAEALARWNHKKYGILAPNTFLDLADKMNLISRIDFIVFEKSCQFIVDTKKKYNFSPCISVNLSIESLIRPNLYNDIKEVLRRYKIDATCITFEILENKLISDFMGMQAITKQIKSLNVKFAIDDFGSGYSNFDTISKLMVEYIKLDKSMINDISVLQKFCDNLKLICQLLKNFDCEIVAEGVETMEQVQILENFGVDFIQGFFYGKPMDGDSFLEKYLKNSGTIDDN